MPTPHNEAKKGEIAKVVLMPGDPKRAEWMANTFLHDVVVVNRVRGNTCYTGLTKNGKRISIMPSGMGVPSMGLYSHELYKEYDVDVIIRVGTCGSYQSYIDLKDILVCIGSCTDNNWMSQYHLNGTFSAIADYELTEEAVKSLKQSGFRYHVGNIFAADVFYDHDPDIWKKWSGLGVMGVEMESYALYVNASIFRKKALTLLTVTDNFVKHGEMSSSERQTGLTNMILTAIDVAEKFA